MKIAFEFDEATPAQIADVIEKFYSTYKDRAIKEDGEEVDSVMIGKINLYISLKCKESGELIGYTKDGKDVVWHVKKPAKNPQKPRKRQFCDNQELGYVICE